MLHRIGKLLIYAYIKPHLVGGHKSELVWDLYIVQQPSRFHSKTQQNKKKPEQAKPKPNKTKSTKKASTIFSVQRLHGFRQVVTHVQSQQKTKKASTKQPKRKVIGGPVQ